MSEKKYELIKRFDTPYATIEPGAWFFKTNGLYYKYEDIVLNAESVEDNPEWFREVKEEQRVVLLRAGGLRYRFSLTPDFREFDLSDGQRQTVEDALNGKLFTKDEVKDFGTFVFHTSKEQWIEYEFRMEQALTEWLKSRTR